MMNSVDDMREWLGTQLQGNLAFCTLTYKEKIPGPGGWSYLTREVQESQTKWLLMRLDRKVFGRRRKSGKLERTVFHEGDGRIKRRHTHFVVRLPVGLTHEAIESHIKTLWAYSDWGRPIIHARDCYDYLRLQKYLTKEGCDAFDPFNSHFVFFRPE